jgi:preprotein translocase SecF subunit
MWWNKPNPNAPPRKEREPFPFMKLRWVGFIVTLTLSIATTVSLATQGLNLGLDFTGGVLIEAHSEKPFDWTKVRGEIESLGFGETSITPADNDKTALIRLPAQQTGADVEPVARKIVEALGEGVEIRSSSAVGPKVSGELFRDGVIAAILAVVGIGLYVWFRFESKFGWGAFITTFHDVYVVIGLFSITRMPFDLNIVAGVLTVAGYSINDTVVVFDRIREMLKKYKKIPLSRIIDISITATLSRTLITSVCTMLASGTMMFLGGPVLYGFAVSITFGIIIGTYSSIFVAAPLLLALPGKMPGAKYQQEGETRDAKAAAKA